MKLRFNLGAIVELTLLGNAEPTIVSGKILDVLEDEVQICPQMRILKDTPICFDPLTGDNDELRTADSFDILHINRQLIRSWRYAKPRDLKTVGTVTEKRNSLYEYAIEDCVLNYYDKLTGFCNGSGPDCSLIEEHYSSAIFMSPPPESDNDGLELELEI